MKERALGRYKHLSQHVPQAPGIYALPRGTCVYVYLVAERCAWNLWRTSETVSDTGIPNNNGRKAGPVASAK